MYLQLFVCFIALILYLRYSSEACVVLTDRGLDSQVVRYMNIMIVILILQSALRNVAVGADTFAYYLQFERLNYLDWKDLFDAFSKTYIEGNGKDPGYSVLGKLVQLVTTNYQIFLLCVAIFFFIGLYRMLKQMHLNLGSICLAILVYEVLYYDFFSITGIRQTIATAFFFYAFPFIKKRKFIHYAVLIVIGATIHKSSIIVLPFYFLAVYNRPRGFLLCALVVLPFLFAVARAFAVYITSFQLFESYAYYANSTYETSGAINFMIFLVVIAILTLIIVKQGVDIDNNMRISINALALALFFVPLTWVDPSLMRVCQYFSVFSMFLFGPILQKFCIKQNLNFPQILICVFILFAAVIIKRDHEYAFFWQQMELPENYGNQIIY